jgi:hypothetical protein
MTMDRLIGNQQCAKAYVLFYQPRHLPAYTATARIQRLRE